MHLTAPSHWSRSIGTNGRDPSESAVTIPGMRKSASALRPPPCAGGSPDLSLGLTLFIEAQASISVPSTEK
jgi:hypothetical protein